MCQSLVITFLLSFSAFANDAVHVPADHATLQEALDHSDASVIVLAPGDHTGAVLHRPATVIGTGARIIDGPEVRPGSPRAGLVVTAAASGTIVEGVIFDCRGPTLDLGVYSSASTVGGLAERVTVRSSAFRACVQGVTVAGRPVGHCDSPVAGGSDWSVVDNHFDGLATRTDRGTLGGGLGVFAFNATGVEVVGNELTGNVPPGGNFVAAGVGLAGCIDCTITDNRIALRGRHEHIAAVANLGGVHQGAASTRGLLLADNDALDGDTHLGFHFLSYDSFDVTVMHNEGHAVLDHAFCGDEVRVRISD